MKTPSDFSIAEIVAGRQAQGEKETNPAIAIQNSTAEIRPTFNLDSVKPNGRMAGGEPGQRALDMMNDPEEQNRVDKWMTAFESFAPWKEGTQYQKA